MVLKMTRISIQERHKCDVRASSKLFIHVNVKHYPFSNLNSFHFATAAPAAPEMMLMLMMMAVVMVVVVCVRLRAFSLTLYLFFPVCVDATP